MLRILFVAAIFVVLVLFAMQTHWSDAATQEEVQATYQGKTAEAWHWRYVREHRVLSRSGKTIRALQGRVYRQSKQLAYRGESPSIMAIRLVFGPYADQAIRVSSCETGGTFSTNATNGQYLGLFQFGAWARQTYGFGASALEQAQAAYRYFKASGWSGWSCKP